MMLITLALMGLQTIPLRSIPRNTTFGGLKSTAALFCQFHCLDFFASASDKAPAARVTSHTYP